MAFLTPEHLVAELAIVPGSTVADVGAGSGAYTVALSRAVTDEGKVYAIDVHKDVLDTLVTGLDKAGYQNVEGVWADIENGVYLDSYSVSAAVLSNTLFMLEHVDKALKEIARILVPKGLLLVVEWSKSHGGLGPHPSAVIDEAHAEAALIKAGFTIRRRLPAGDYHYALIAEIS